MHDKDNWVRDLAFERHLLYPVVRTESVFVGWHNAEVFAALVSYWQELYTICSA